MEVYPNNTLTNYVTRLPNRIELEGQWEVGLVEIQYPHTWYNVPEAEEHRSFKVVEGDGDSREEYPFVIPSGYYSITALLTHITSKANQVLNLTRHSRLITGLEKVTGLVWIHCIECSLHIPPFMKRVLGKNLVFPSGKNDGDHVFDIDPIHSMYVYCDIVEPRMVVDSMVPLLRVVPVEGANRNMVTCIYENVHYIALQRKSFDTVEIDIKDSTGQSMPFERGTLNVTLHF